MAMIFALKEMKESGRLKDLNAVLLMEARTHNYIDMYLCICLCMCVYLEHTYVYTYMKYIYECRFYIICSRFGPMYIHTPSPSHTTHKQHQQNQGEEENSSEGFRETVLQNLHWFRGTGLILQANSTWIAEDR
jgi:hypothetical protein